MRSYLSPMLAAALITTVMPCHASVQVAAWVSSEDGRFALAPGEPQQLTAGPPAADTVIHLDASITYQSILGFGASLEHATCANLARLDPVKREEVIERLVDPVKGIGMNLMRVCIGTSDFVGEPYYSYDDLPAGEMDPDLAHFTIAKDRDYVLPVLKTALAKNPDLLFFASPWSPPGWMKSTGSMCAGKLKPEYYETYARYLAAFVRAYAAEGIPMYALTTQNEPRMIHPGYPTCLWSGERQRDFIRENLGPLFEQNHFDTRIWCWDHNWNFLEFPRAVLSDPQAARYVDGTAFHLYEGDVEAQGTFHDEFPDKHIYFTEGSTFRSWGAVRVAQILRNWARSYDAWVILLDEHRKPNRGPHSASATCIELKDDLSVEYRFDYYMYGHFMKFIPRGALRIASTEGDRRFANVAFRAPGGDLVLVVANADRHDLTFSVVSGDRTFQAALPAKSVGTYRWRPES